MSGKLALFLLQLTTKKSFWATLVAILLTIIGFIGFLMFVLFGTALAGTYTAEDDVILAVDAQYSNMEKALSRSLQNGPALYPGYDEYVYNLAEVGHDGNILASYLSALHPRYTQNIVQSDLDALLAEQYMVSTYETIEIRERIYIGSGYWVESCYGHGACINNWTDEQNGGHAYRQFWRYVGFD